MTFFSFWIDLVSCIFCLIQSFQSVPELVPVCLGSVVANRKQTSKYALKGKAVRGKKNKHNKCTTFPPFLSPSLLVFCNRYPWCRVRGIRTWEITVVLKIQVELQSSSGLEPSLLFPKNKVVGCSSKTTFCGSCDTQVSG